MRRFATALPWIAWVVAIAVLVGSCPGRGELGEYQPLTRGQQVAAVGALLAVAAAHLFSAIYKLVADYLPANGWRPIDGDVFAWFRPWFVFVRGHPMVVASWRAACDVLRTRLAGLGYADIAAIAETGRYTATTLFVHPEKPAFAAVALTIDRAPRLQLLFASLLSDGTLVVTATDVEKRGNALPHETLPLVPRGNAQELPGLAPGSLLSEHERTVAGLGPARRASANDIAAALASATADRRRAFLSRPIRNMWLAWWRSTRR